MTQDLRMLPVPPHVRDGAMEKAIRELPVEHRFEVRMAVRRAYAEGYDDGHRDGYREARDDAFAEKEQAAARTEAAACLSVPRAAGGRVVTGRVSVPGGRLA